MIFTLDEGIKPKRCNGQFIYTFILRFAYFMIVININYIL